MNSTEKDVRFCGSRSFKDLVGGIYPTNALEMFEKYPFIEVRKKCLEEMKKVFIQDFHAEWAEECVIDLLKQNDSFADDILSWYLFSIKFDSLRKNELDVRSIEFVINLGKNMPRFWMDKASKLVAGKLLRDDLDAPSWLIYREIPSLHEFLGKLLNGLKSDSSKERGYFNNDWYCAERAQSIILKFRDHSFLTEIENLCSMYKKGEIKPNQSVFREDAMCKHIAGLIFLKRVLRKAKRENS